MSGNIHLKFLKKLKISIKLLMVLSYLFTVTFCTTGQVNVISYKSRPNAKDFIQVEIVVEKNSQKIILIGKVIFFIHEYT